MSALPFVLAGPIVRRVEPRRVSVWVALSVPAKVKLNVWLGPQFAGNDADHVESGDQILATGERDTLTFGHQLHVVVVTAKAEAAPLHAGEVYSYQLGFTGAGTRKDLKDALLLIDETDNARIPGVDPAAPLSLALGYQPNRLPSFILPAETVEGLKLAHGSCRKPHANGPDALGWLDERLKLTLDDRAERPQQLFLTGDQIYADDVAAPLLHMLSMLGTSVINSASVDEENPVTHEVIETTGGIELKLDLENFPAARRAKAVRFEAKFSTGDADNHLLAFKEYAAMYLAAWSPRVWRELPRIFCAECDWEADITVWPEDLAGPDKNHLPGKASICRIGMTHIYGALSPDVVAPDILTRPETCSDHPSLAEWHNAKGNGLGKQRKAITVYRDAVPHVARALANIATYMIFDDHEVTDDWNISLDFIRAVSGTPFGTAVLRNGLVAYGIFQGWGNDPAAFDVDGPNKDFLDEAVKVLAPGAKIPAASTNKLHKVLGLVFNDASPRVKWHYQLPGVKHLTVVLDTRTRRGFPAALPVPARLVGDTLGSQLPAGPHAQNREVLILVSPVPVIGPALIEQVAQPLKEAIDDVRKSTDRDKYDECNPVGHIEGRYENDVESWAANELAFEELIARAATYDRVVILSGDVHYGTAFSLDYWKKGNANAVSRIVQLTASALHNPVTQGFRPIIRRMATLQGLAMLPTRARMGWTNKSTIKVPQGAKPGLGRLVRLQQSPSIVPAEGWPAGTSFPDDKPPDWAWRITPARDDRPRSSLPDEIRPRALQGADIDTASADTIFDSYSRVATRHGLTALADIDHLRLIVFESNIGLVRFARANGELQVTQLLLSREAPNAVKPAPNTEHVITLARATEHPELTHA